MNGGGKEVLGDWVCSDDASLFKVVGVLMSLPGSGLWRFGELDCGSSWAVSGWTA